MFVFLIILLCLLALCFAIGGYTFFVACGRGKEIDWTDEAAVKATPFGQFYTYIAQGRQFLREHNAQDVYMTNREGLRLHAVWVPASNAKGTIIFAHGFRSCGLSDFSLALELYHNLDMNILLLTQRTHSPSEGKYITFGVTESRDMRDWIDYHNANLGKFPILCSGLSMGASTVMYLAGMDLPENVRGFVADCGFTSPYEIISHVFTQKMHLPAWPVMWAADLFARVFAGFSLKEYHTTQTLQKNTRPILLVHGLEDDFVPAEMTRRSFEACGGEKHLLLVEEAGHGISFLVARQAYLEQIHQLVEKVQNIEL
jgi:fermentation-respiration switch protein FrsA (DUF1100 family)